LDRAIRTAVGRGQLDVATITELATGWANPKPGFVVETDYALEVVARCTATRGPILECGTGLTTILLGLVARETGAEVISLEHDPAWHRRIAAVIDRHNLPVDVRLAPLADFGTFSWYGLSPEALQPGIAVCVCDGPPQQTPGGRRGLLSVVGGRFRPGAIVLLDDADRPGEQAAIQDWVAEHGAKLIGGAGRYAVLEIA
jgi:predicted O-methyltransferase YrrM